MRLMVALGGNALLRRGERPDAAVQQQHVREAALALAPLAREHQLIVCHGNGPQIGLLAVESSSDVELSRTYPLDVLGAQTQGMIGYWLAQELHNAGVGHPVVAVVTQTVVGGHDPAFGAPTKFVGAGHPRAVAERIAAEHGWQVAADGDPAGDAPVWRRVVPSPEPVRIVEAPLIRRLVDDDVVVVCGGGGGSPVTEDAQGHLAGTDAVVDKDLTAAMMALVLGADRLLLLTDVRSVMRDFGTSRAAAVARLRPDDVPGLHLPAGSMGPKVEACRRFACATGHPAAIGSLEDVAAVLAGEAGTTFTAH